MVGLLEQSGQSLLVFGVRGAERVNLSLLQLYCLNWCFDITMTARTRKLPELLDEGFFVFRGHQPNGLNCLSSKTKQHQTTRTHKFNHCVLQVTSKSVYLH